MPFLIKTCDQIMHERQTDVCFLQFHLFIRGCDVELQRQIDWLVAREVVYEAAAPKGWLEGDPGCYAIHFAGRVDPRLTAYSDTFENADGGTLNPDIYQMYLIPFELWAKRQA